MPLADALTADERSTAAARSGTFYPDDQPSPSQKLWPVTTTPTESKSDTSGRPYAVLATLLFLIGIGAFGTASSGDVTAALKAKRRGARD